MLGLVAFAVALQPRPSTPPRTVNDGILGVASGFTTSGPAKVCLGSVVVRPIEGQTVQLGYSGIHNATLLLRESFGEIVIQFSEIFRASSPEGKLIERNGDQQWRKTVDAKGVLYTLYAKDSASRAVRPRLNVRGPQLKGTSSDQKYLQAISLSSHRERCDRRYNYGWGVILDGEPVIDPSP